MQHQAWRMVLAGMLILSGIGLVQADDHEIRYGGLDVAPVNNQRYAEECGACHFAYQPGLLPARSWRKVMENLADHFDENAELNEDVRQAMQTYLENNSADNANEHLSRKVKRYLGQNKTVVRISEIGFLAHEHDEIPRRVFEGELQGLANCDACHQRAVQGSYSESEINIPGYGRWDD